MKYYIGIDLGTSSLGYACVDENYNIMRKKGKDLWGVHLFKEGETAAARREFRSLRRRGERKKWRLQLLREIFEDEINKVDENFYQRMEDSKFIIDDKKIKAKSVLFNDVDFKDKDYFKKFPTIFHLRQHLIYDNSKKDIRLYFLAINQMMKRRGNFILEGELSNLSDVTPYINEVKDLFDDIYSAEIPFDTYAYIIDVLALDENKTSKKNKVKELLLSTDLTKEEQKELFSYFELCISTKLAISSFIKDKEEQEELKNKGITHIDLSDEAFEQNKDILNEYFGDAFRVFEVLKALRDFSLLKNKLKGERYLCDAQVKSYETHKEDLNELKTLLKDQSLRKEVLSDIDSPYVKYLGYYLKNNSKVRVGKITKDEFYKVLIKMLDKHIPKDDKVLNNIKTKIELNQYMPKQISDENAVINNQVHLLELKEIVKALERDYPSFKEKHLGDKIIKLFRFKIPYYVGPLNDAHKKDGSNVWIVRKKGYENDKITPWNFSDVVDEAASEAEFIKRMINECTYLPGEKVIAKSSLLYQKFLVLNELNNLKINNKKLDSDLKQKIFEDLYQKNKRVTLKRLEKYLKANNYDDNIIISGIDTDLKANLSSYVEFKKILGDAFHYDKVEMVIEALTIHHGNKNILKIKVKEIYPELNNETINKIVNVSCSEWAPLSRKLLAELKGVYSETGEVNTVINFMKLYPLNLQEIVGSNENFSFAKEIKELRNASLSDSLTYKDLDSFYLSPAVKKMTWKAKKLIDELIKTIGYKPEKIFIEMARGEDEIKERSVSRKNQLIDIYKNIKNSNRDWLEELNNYEEEDFRNRALYLYFMQMGKDIYTGENIHLDDKKIIDRDDYDLDHIVPRSIKKDDSIINNLVLTTKNNNSKKSNTYPVPNDLVTKEARELWEILYKKGFMSKEKYSRLKRVEPLSDAEKADFIARQLVETRQSTKALKDLLELFTDIRVVSVKAGLVSDERKNINVLKCRDINDYHHAHDAYLNVVVGNLWDQKFTTNYKQFIDSKESYNLSKFLINDQYARGKKIWDHIEGVDKIKTVISKPSVLFSSEAYEESGALFNATIVGKKDIKSKTLYLPLKNDPRLKNIAQYGAYGTLKGSYFYLVEHTKKNKVIRSILFVPLYLRRDINKNINILKKFYEETLGLENIELICKILTNQEIIIDKFPYLITGRSDTRFLLKANKQMFWNIEDTNLFNELINKYNKAKKYNKTSFFKDGDKDKMIQLSEKLINRLSEEPFNRRKNIPDIHNIDLETFNQMEIMELLLNILNIAKVTSNGADLSLINGDKNSGRIKISNNLSGDVYIQNTSITGIYKTKRKIN